MVIILNVVTLPEYLQFAIFIIQACTEQLHSRILHFIISQVQHFKTERLFAENWGQICAAFLCEITVT